MVVIVSKDDEIELKIDCAKSMSARRNEGNFSKKDSCFLNKVSAFIVSKAKKIETTPNKQGRYQKFALIRTKKFEKDKLKHLPKIAMYSLPKFVGFIRKGTCKYYNLARKRVFERN